jgi:tRNA threonylcarbamoyladenosine biosynthesis protein TsaE
MEILIRNKKGIPAAVKKLMSFAEGRKIFAFFGAMGSGKTTIIKAICKHLGAVDMVSSPTFTLINEYISSEGRSLYHIDFYRIRKHDEVFDFGIEEYLSAGNYCFMEWPELVEDIIPENAVRVKIIAGNDQERKLIVS